MKIHYKGRTIKVVPKEKPSKDEIFSWVRKIQESEYAKQPYQFEVVIDGRIYRSTSVEVLMKLIDNPPKPENFDELAEKEMRDCIL